jgi:BASS family bile acid:Na+ symporter
MPLNRLEPEVVDTQPAPPDLSFSSVGRLAMAAAWVRRWFLLLLIGVYGLAAFAPGWGAAAREISFTSFPLGGRVTFPAALLAVLLFSAGLGMNVTSLFRLRHFSLALTAGVAASCLLGPAVVGVLIVFANAAGFSESLPACLTGLALVAIMPPANSSAAWTQNARGSLPLCLAMLLAATLLCPGIAPAVLAWLTALRGGEPAAHPLHGAGGTLLLLLWVAAPIGLGMAARCCFRPGVIERLGPALGLSNAAILLVLNYCQASLALPRLRNGAMDTWLTVAATSMGFTACLFAGGWLVGRAIGANVEERLALLFNLGMKNTGAALALGGAAFASQPAALLAIVFCTLSQHVLAALADLLIRRGAAVGSFAIEVEPPPRKPDRAPDCSCTHGA